MSRALLRRRDPLYRNSRPKRTSEASSFSTPDAPDYAAAREVYKRWDLNPARKSSLCVSETGVQHAVERAKAENWPVAVKAGGHSFEGFCLNDDGLVVSVFANAREMQLDPKTSILTAGAGCRLRKGTSSSLRERPFPARWILQNSRSGRPY